jgi:hypothetical protein
MRHITQRVDRYIRICVWGAENRQQQGKAAQAMVPFSRRLSGTFGHG